MTPKQAETWQYLVECCKGAYGLNSINIGTQNRRQAIIAVADELERLRLTNEVEALSLNHPDNTKDCDTLALDHLTALGRVAALTAELEIERIATARLTSEITLLSDEVQGLRLGLDK